MHMATVFILVGLFSFSMLAYLGRGYMAWLSAALFSVASMHASHYHLPMQTTTLAAIIFLAVVFGIPAIRMRLSKLLMGVAAKSIPTIGDTERIALEAGTVWWEGELFSGKPNWSKLLKFNIKALTKEEQAFLDGPVAELCDMLDDEEVHKLRDLPPKVWAHIKKHKFFGMIIPKAFGGLEFSAAAHSAVVTKISSRSLAAAVTVMVPNSLGPGELLMRYGTKEQQKQYLPGLAVGDHIPCFALTEPTAGSDAANGLAVGIVTKGKWEGKEVIGLSLTFNKRYITLAPVATVIGLAFRMKDPNHLLGSEEDIGITCALLPRDTPGMNIGNRHDPMGVPFMNGPITGKDVFVPMDYIIGGLPKAGQGWRMLMEALAAGRGISLPSLSVGAAQLSARATSAYASIREQFGMPIGKFEGVRERLARVFGLSYAMNATRLLTVGAVDAGEHPSVASAISKAYLTEGMRTALNDGMDITAGSSICRGPRNIFSRPYDGIPIGITVEGANILTRSLIVFGQGAIRSHPFLQAEVDAIAKQDVKAFDRAFFGHVNHAVRNAMRALLLGLSGGLFALPPKHAGMAHHYRHIARLSAAFAFIADIGLITLGGALKRKEYLSGRYADAFAWLYIATATLKHHHDNGAPDSHRALVNWTIAHALNNVENALMGVLRNLPNRPAALVARAITFPFGLGHNQPSDRLVDKVVDSVLNNTDGMREHLTAAIHVPDAGKAGLGHLDATYAAVMKAAPARARVLSAIRKGELKRIEDAPEETLDAAIKLKLINAEEKALLLSATAMRDDAIQVDFFDPKKF